jgi:hypothetical protein
MLSLRPRSLPNERRILILNLDDKPEGLSGDDICWTTKYCRRTEDNQLVNRQEVAQGDLTISDEYLIGSRPILPRLVVFLNEGLR